MSIKAFLVESNANVLLEALRRIAKLAESGVVIRHETDKPTWYANEEIAKIARAAITKADR